MIAPEHPRLSIQRQCSLVPISQSAIPAASQTPLDLALIRMVDDAFRPTPRYGSRQMARRLRRQAYEVSRIRVGRLTAEMSLAPIHQKPRTTIPQPEHRAHRHLLRGLTIDRSGQYWCAYIT